jgi:hypothetical protein
VRQTRSAISSVLNVSTKLFAYQREPDDHGVLASIGSVGGAYDNAMAEPNR